MKKIVGIALVVGAGIMMAFSFPKENKQVATVVVAEQQGIQFESMTYAEALVKSKKTGKLIFIDCYTSWCGPCKALAAKTFTDPSVGDFFNKNFINLKIEMEKDAEGPELARLFKVRAYPTMVLVNDKGEVVATQMGFVGPETLLDFAKSNVKKAK